MRSPLLLFDLFRVEDRFFASSDVHDAQTRGFLPVIGEVDSIVDNGTSLRLEPLPDLLPSGLEAGGAI